MHDEWMYTTSELKEEYLETVLDKERSVVSGVLDKVSIQEIEIGRPIAEFSESDFAKLLGRCVKHSRNTFSSRKKIVYAYLKWMFDNDNVTDNAISALKKVSYDNLYLEDTFKRDFFSSYDSFITYIEWAMDLIKKSTEASEEVYDLTLALLFLAWEGVETEEVIAIRKDGVDIDTGIWLPLSKKYIHPEPRALQHLIFYRDAITYPLIGNLTKSYCKSEYLVRSYLHSEFTAQDVSGTIYRFNKKVSSKMPKKFSYERVRLSGIYARVKNKETEEINVDKLIGAPIKQQTKEIIDKTTGEKKVTNIESRVVVLSRLFDIDFKSDCAATDMARSYLAWRKFYHGN